MPDTKSLRKRNLPLVLLAIAPAMLLSACNVQEKQELAAALARADAAAQRAEAAQHLAEAAAARARSDKLAAARDYNADPVEEDKPVREAQPNPAPSQDDDRADSEPG